MDIKLFITIAVSVLLGAAFGVAGILFFIRKLKAGADAALLNKNNQLEEMNLNLLKKITVLYQKYRRLYSILKKLRFDYQDELKNSKLLQESNEIILSEVNADTLIKEHTKIEIYPVKKLDLKAEGFVQ